MTLGEFSTAFKRLLDAHGKSFHEGISDTYYDQVKSLSLKQWEDAVEILIKTCETFPKIPTIRRVITEKGLWNYSTANSGMYVFTCQCSKDVSTELVTNAGRLQKDIEENRSYPCPNKMYEKCNKTYSAEYFRSKAKYYPSQN